MFVSRNSLSGKPLSKLSCVCLPLEKLVYFPEFTFQETSFQTFLCLFVIRKACQRKTFSSHRKIWLGFQESVSWKFGRKTLSRSCEKFKNIILFADYIKLSSQTFDCSIYIYIFFFLNIYFSISSLKI